VRRHGRVVFSGVRGVAGQVLAFGGASSSPGTELSAGSIKIKGGNEASIIPKQWKSCELF